MSDKRKGRVTLCYVCAQRLQRDYFAGHLPGVWDEHENRKREACVFCGQRTLGRYFGTLAGVSP